MDAVTEQIAPKLQGLLACLSTALGEVGWEGECCVEPGDVDWLQDCCVDGGPKAWVRLIDAFPTRVFPLQSEPIDPKKCEIRWALRAEIGANDCSCVNDCDCDVKTANARRVWKIMEALLATVACCDIEDMVVVSGSTQGPEGNCAGATMQVLIPTSVCCA